MIRGLPIAWMIALAVLLPAQSVFARNLVWNFQGTFTAVPLEYQALGLNVGDALSGTLQVNSNARDAYPADPVRGQYDLAKLTVCVAALSSCWTFSGPHSAHVMTVFNDNPQSPPYDFLEIYGRDVPLDSTANPTQLFFFNGPAGVETFSSDGVPSIPPLVSSFQFLTFQYTDTNITPASSASGTINAISSR
jgi:hypothetical protein